MGCVSLRLVAMETQLRRDFKSATRLFSGLKERGHYTIGLECVYILSVQRMPGTWTDSWVEKEGFLIYVKTPCKKWSPSSQKWSPSSTSVRPLKWWVHNSTEESHFWFIARVLPTWTQFLPPSLPTKFPCIMLPPRHSERARVQVMWWPLLRTALCTRRERIEKLSDLRYAINSTLDYPVL